MSMDITATPQQLETCSVSESIDLPTNPIKWQVKLVGPLADCTPAAGTPTQAASRTAAGASTTVTAIDSMQQAYIHVA